MRDESGGVAERVGDVGGEHRGDGVHGAAALQPDLDVARELVDVPVAEQQPGVDAPQPAEQRHGRLAAGRYRCRFGYRVGLRLRLGRWYGGRFGGRCRCGGGGLWGRRGRGGCYGRFRDRDRDRFGLRLRFGCRFRGRGCLGCCPGRGLGWGWGGEGGLRVVVGHRSGDEATVGELLPEALQVAVLLQFAERRGDAGLSLGDAPGQVLDAHGRAGRQCLDVRGQALRGQGQLGVPGQVVTGDLVPGRVPHLAVLNAVPRARGRDKLRKSHGEGFVFLFGQALGRDCRPDGGRLMSAVVGASICPATSPKSSPVGLVHPCE